MRITDRIDGEDGAFRDVILGYDDLASYQVNTPHFGAPIGRNANRIGNAVITIDGKDYKLEANNGPNNLHSGPDLYHSRLWESWAYETAEGSRLDFFLNSPDGDQGYPGNAKIRISYTLTEDSCLKIDYSMVADADTVANFTNHCYFNLAGHASGTACNAKVWLDADAFTETDAELIPTGTVIPVEGTPMDFREGKKVAKEIGADYKPLKLAGGYDHNWVLNGSGFRKVASAESEETGIKMEVYTDLPGIQFYSGNFLAGAKGKEGAVYGKGCGICFETQYFPDAIHKDNFESPITKAGEVYDTTTTYRFC